LGMYAVLPPTSISFWLDGLRMLAVITAGTAVYVFVCWITRVEEISLIWNLLRSKRRRPQASDAFRNHDETL
jgi:hypothetical protein